MSLKYLNKKIFIFSVFIILTALYFLQSLQVNIDAGKLPVREQNKQRYLKIPINQK